MVRLSCLTGFVYAKINNIHSFGLPQRIQTGDARQWYSPYEENIFCKELKNLINLWHLNQFKTSKMHTMSMIKVDSQYEQIWRNFAKVATLKLSLAFVCEFT